MVPRRLSWVKADDRTHELPLPFGRGEGRVRGWLHGSECILLRSKSVPLTPPLSPSEGERETPARSRFLSEPVKRRNL
jgi:hypothetical protein